LRTTDVMSSCSNTFSVSYIEKALACLKGGKASGFDNIVKEHLTHSHPLTSSRTKTSSGGLGWRRSFMNPPAARTYSTRSTCLVLIFTVLSASWRRSSRATTRPSSCSPTAHVRRRRLVASTSIGDARQHSMPSSSGRPPVSTSRIRARRPVRTLLSTPKRNSTISMKSHCSC